MKMMNAAAGVALALLALPLEAGVTGTAKPRAPQGVPVVDITFEPISAAHPTCPPFGPCPPGSQITTEYQGFGVDFTQFGGHPPVGVFVDPPEKFGGVNGGGILDLVTASCGRIVVVGSTSQGLTDFIGASAGGVGGPSDILLEAFNPAGTLIGSSIADDGVDPDGGDLIAEVSDPTQQIASFCISTPTADTYGMHFVYLNTPIAVPVTLQTFEIE
jgi:hypothetical protein